MSLINQHFHLRIETDKKNGTIKLTQSLGFDDENEIILNPCTIDAVVKDLEYAKEELLKEQSSEE